MKFRFKAFGLHLLASVALLTLVLGGLYVGWYYWPGWYLTKVLHVVLVLVLVDAALGPTLTLIIANPNKPRRELTRDITIIAAVQIVAMCIGAATLWHGRPMYYLFSTDHLDIAQASDLPADEVARARRENPEFAPHWYSTARWVWAPLPDDAEEAKKIMTGAVVGGTDIVDMPRVFRPWNAALPEIRKNLLTVDELTKLSPQERTTVKARMAALGLSSEEKNAMTMWGYASRLVAIFDTSTLKIRTLLRTD